MKTITYKEIVTEELANGAILNEAHVGFREDYLVLHCLLKIYEPTTFLEIGTNQGVGTRIIKNALGEFSKVFSLDLPVELAHVSMQHAIHGSEGNVDRTGKKCDLPYVQLLGDSMNFDYTEYYPIEGWYIDGEHDHVHALHESTEALKSGAKLIVWHDTDMTEVMSGIQEALKTTFAYDFFRVTDTRISYAIKKQL